MRQLRPRQDRPRLPDRGAEDRQEGAQGADPVREEEQIGVGRYAGNGITVALWGGGWVLVFHCSGVKTSWKTGLGSPDYTAAAVRLSSYQ